MLKVILGNQKQEHILVHKSHAYVTVWFIVFALNFGKKAAGDYTSLLPY